MIQADNGNIRISGKGTLLMGELSTIVEALVSDGCPKNYIVDAVKTGIKNGEGRKCEDLSRLRDIASQLADIMRKIDAQEN